jgi:hypothetical protein
MSAGLDFNFYPMQKKLKWYLVAEALDAGCAVGQDVLGVKGVARLVEAGAAAPLARVPD